MYLKLKKLWDKHKKINALSYLVPSFNFYRDSGVNLKSNQTFPPLTSLPLNLHVHCRNVWDSEGILRCHGPVACLQELRNCALGRNDLYKELIPRVRARVCCVKIRWKGRSERKLREAKSNTWESRNYLNSWFIVIPPQFRWKLETKVCDDETAMDSTVPCEVMLWNGKGRW
jgi:hypothetical protein